MKKTLIALGIFCLMGALAYSADNYEYLCGTITEIYGVCSEELARNWLEHQADNAYPMVQETVKSRQDNSDTNEKHFTLPNATQNLTEVYCWYMIDGAEKCRLNQMFFTTGERRVSSCDGYFNYAGGEICDFTK